MPRKRRTKAQKQFDDILGAVAAYNPNAPKDMTHEEIFKAAVDSGQLKPLPQTEFQKHKSFRKLVRNLRTKGQ